MLMLMSPCFGHGDTRRWIKNWPHCGRPWTPSKGSTDFMEFLRRRLGLWRAQWLKVQFRYHARTANRLHRKLTKLMASLERPRLLGGE